MARTGARRMGGWSVVLAALAMVAALSRCAEASVGPHYLQAKTYSTVFPAYPCVTLVGKEGPIGCTTSEDGRTGFLKALSSAEEVASFNPKSNSPLVVVLPSELFDKARYDYLVEHSVVQGILITRDEQLRKPDAFSPVHEYPNKHYGLYPQSDLKWNPSGDGFSYERLSVPIFALDAAQSVDVLEAALENEGDLGMKWGATLGAWMYPYEDTDPETCLRRGTCDPLGGKSVIGALDTVMPEQEIVLVAATLDATAFFHNLASGATAYQSGVIAALAAAQALAQYPRSTFAKQPLFALFDGEAWGYTGSRLFADDISEPRFNCTAEDKTHCSVPFRASLLYKNVTIEQVTHVIDASQLGRPERDASSGELRYYLHTDSRYGSTSDLRAHFKLAASAVPKIRVSDETPWMELPPSPTQTFLRSRSSISAAVFADHATEFRSSHHMSRFDDASALDLDALCRAASVLTRAVYATALGRANVDSTDIPAGLKADCTLVHDLAACFTESINCNLTRNFYTFAEGMYPPSSHYVGVYSRHRTTLDNKFIFDWLMNATASARSEGQCQVDSDCDDGGWCVAYRCVWNDHTFFYDALSPGFEYGHDGMYHVVNTSEPLWTEARWRGTHVQVFEMMSPTSDVVVFVGGVVFLAVTLLLLLLVQRVCPFV